MTQPPEDTPALWLKQVPRHKTGVPALWSQSLIPNHNAIRRSAERPRENADGPTLSRLLVALDNLHPQGRNLPEDKPLLEVMRAYDAYRRFEIHGEE
ncbi:hypothetical protein ACM25O_13405 [Sulfitobacter pontiacus]